MQAWTRQLEQVLTELERDGIYRAKEWYIRMKNGSMADYYLERYRWYMGRAEAIVPRPAGAEAPIWLFLSDEVKLPPLPGAPLLELDIPAEKIVISDSQLWGYAINYMYCPLDKADEEAHDRALAAMGISSETALFQTDKGNFYPLLKRKIIDSWPRMFLSKPLGTFSAQGTVWELRKEWLTNVYR